MKRLKTWAAALLLAAIIISSIIRSFNQVFTLVNANKENRDLASKIEKLKYENKVLERKIQEASSSAYIDELIHDKLGMAKINDYWIVMPQESHFEDLYPEVSIGDKKANWQMWLELFTKG